MGGLIGSGEADDMPLFTSSDQIHFEVVGVEKKSNIFKEVPHPSGIDRISHLDPLASFVNASNRLKKATPAARELNEELLDHGLELNDASVVVLAKEVLAEGYDMVTKGDNHVRVLDETVIMKRRERGEFREVAVVEPELIRRIDRVGGSTPIPELQTVPSRDSGQTDGSFDTGTITKNRYEPTTTPITVPVGYEIGELKVEPSLSSNDDD